MYETLTFILIVISIILVYLWCNQKQRKMKATLENLKANRLEFIAELNELFGEENLRASMEILRNEVEFAELYNPFMTIDDVIQCELVGQGLFEETRKKTSQLAEMNGNWMENKGHTSFDHLNKKYV